jgi:catechol 2,3-dioxygenase-like lactoylglutathione lyase family enzyme
MTTQLSQVQILVDDPDAALAFYRDALGLSVRFEVTNGGFRWITLGTDSQPEIAIVLMEPHAGRSQADGDTVAALLAKGELRPVQFSSDNLEATWSKVVATPGVSVVEEPADQPWGVRDGAVRDPAGNLVRIQQVQG